MKFGVCCGAGRFAAVKRAGYDYIEAPLCDIAAMDAAAFAAYCAHLRENALAAETFNCFFPGGMQLVGEEAERRHLPKRCGAWRTSAIKRCRCPALVPMIPHG